MARKPEITRTLTTSKVTFKAANLTADTLETRTVTIPRKYKNDNDILKALAAVVPAEIKPLSVVSVEIGSALYGLSEADFIKYAHILPDRGTSTIADNADNDTAAVED